MASAVDTTTRMHPPEELKLAASDENDDDDDDHEDEDADEGNIFNPVTSYVIIGGELEGTNRYISSESLYHLIEYNESDSRSYEQFNQII